MVTNPMILKQIDYFEKIGSLVMLPVWVWDGLGHKNYFGKNRHVYFNSKLHDENKVVQDICRFDGRQIILDPEDTWENVKIIGDKFLKFLNGLQQVPFELLYTGRNIRIHIYLDDSIKYYARHNRMDLQDLCFKVYQYICYLSDNDWKTNGVPENQSKHHLLGTIGKKNLKTGYYCTYLFDKKIPDKQPQTKLEDVKFPRVNSFGIWKVPEIFLNNACDYAAKIPVEEVKRVFKNTSYFGVMSQGVL